MNFYFFLIIFYFMGFWGFGVSLAAMSDQPFGSHPSAPVLDECPVLHLTKSSYVHAFDQQHWLLNLTHAQPASCSHWRQQQH